jgi:hypothetical protein
MNDEIDMVVEIESFYEGWRQIWDLDQMTLRDIYEAGFRHGFDCATEKITPSDKAEEQK